MNESLRLATKAQATAVRDYLATLGIELSHTQALEVIARGEGMRSHHLLANGNAPAAHKPAIQNWGPRTVVAYSYADGANCKRSSQLVFRGRLKPEQLRFIVSRLDEQQFFVPTQIGFESLHFAFTDFCGHRQPGVSLRARAKLEASAAARRLLIGLDSAGARL